MVLASNQVHYGLLRRKPEQNGVIPILGAKNLRQAQENAGAIGWQMSAEEYKRIDEVARFSHPPTQVSTAQA